MDKLVQVYLQEIIKIHGVPERLC